VLPGKKYAPEDILRIAWRRKWLILLPFVAVSIATAVVAYLLPDRFRSDTLIMVVPQRVPESYVKSTVTTSIEDRLSTIKQQILSRTRLERIIQEFNLYPRERRTGIMEDVIDQMRKDIDVQIVKGDAFTVSYTSPDPRTAMKVADRLASAFIDESLTDRTVLAESTTSFLETQLEDARRRLEDHEKKLADYKMKHAGELPTERETTMQAISNLQMQVQAVIESMNRDKDRRYQIEKTIADLSSVQQTAPNVTISGDDPTSVAGGTTAAQLEVARAQLRLLEMRYKPDHPDVGRMKRIIRDLETKQQADALQRPLSPGSADRPLTPEEAARAARLKDARNELDMVDRQIAGKQAEEKRLRGLMAGYQVRVEAMPGSESDLTGLLRDYDTLRKTYEGLLAKQEDSQVAANLERRQIGEQFRTLDPARLPEKPISPNRPLIDLLGAFAGLGLGVGLVAMLEYRDTSFRTDDEVVSVLALPVVAVIPLMLSKGEFRKLRRQTMLIGSAFALAVIGVVAVAAWLWWRWRF
jgi:polysaccharide chain length determinant protein (PEP-CTERM system associated)